MHPLEHTILATAAAWKQQGIAHGARRPSIGAVAETFLQRMLLVFMALVSGSLVVAEVAVDRPYATWCGGGHARLKTLGVGVLALGSDRAQALIKLAETGLDCLSIPDVFHLSHELAKSASLAIFGRLRHAQQALTQAGERLGTWQASRPAGAQTPQAQGVVEPCEAEVQHWQGVRSAYRNHLANLSLRVPPWCLVDSTRQPSQEVERQLHTEITALAPLIETNGLPVKHHALNKVCTQLAGVSSLVDLWGQTVWHDGEHRALTPMWQHWVDEMLLPLMYWQQHLSHTRCPRQKAKIILALNALQDTCERHPCTQRLAPEVLAAWKAWAAEQAKAFALRQRWKGATALCRRCTTIIAACPHVAPECGQGCTTSMVAPQMGRRPLRGFSGGNFLISLRACYRTSTTYPGLGSAIRPSREVRETP